MPHNLVDVVFTAEQAILVVELDDVGGGLGVLGVKNFDDCLVLFLLSQVFLVVSLHEALVHHDVFVVRQVVRDLVSLDHFLTGASSLLGCFLWRHLLVVEI